MRKETEIALMNAFGSNIDRNGNFWKVFEQMEKIMDERIAELWAMVERVMPATESPSTLTKPRFTGEYAFDTETYPIESGQLAPHMPSCAAVKIDPAKYQVMFGNTPITGFANNRTLVTSYESGEHHSWEECTACELAIGDVVTHIQVGRQWVECKQQNGDQSAGFRVVGTDVDGVYGFVLYGDGTNPPGMSTLFSLDNPAKLRVIPWDSRPQASDHGKWNGTCAKCGRGTYTGFTSTEHEGGTCE